MSVKGSPPHRLLDGERLVEGGVGDRLCGLADGQGRVVRRGGKQGAIGDGEVGGRSDRASC